MGILQKLFGAKPAREPEAGGAPARPDPLRFTVKASPERVAEEACVKVDVFDALPDALRAAGVFRADTVDDIVAELRRRDVPFRPVSAYPLKCGAMFPLADGSTATLDECLTLEAAEDVNAVKLVSQIAGDLGNRIQRRYDLRRWAAMGVETVTLMPGGAPDVCPKMKRLRKTYPIDAVPEIPLPGCSAKACFCGYQPRI